MSGRGNTAPGGGASAVRPEAVTPTLLRGWPLPGGGSGKNDRGSVLVIGGARMTPGAALLAGVAALRSGAGRLTLAVAESVAVQLAVALPEAGVKALPENASGSVLGAKAVPVLAPLVDSADAILIGPGLDNKDEATALLRGLLAVPAGDKRPAIILDAFALGSLPELVDDLDPWAGRLILTPNVTEAGILLGRDVGDLAGDVPELAAKYGAVVSCQGVIAQPGGPGSPGRQRGPGAEADGHDGGTGRGVWEITTGHSGLGTSGSGDVLSGAIAGLRARGTTDAQATCWGTHLHASAGDRLASRLGGLGYLARELTGELPALMMELGT
ncbi:MULTISPECIES: ADP-dependent NAD(P)H-hydrate dehydratase [unclassified Arthrobacter]|uniref:ADP-dependent NAD(P)H-hydrate dehydratase n=1 Tax=unclassified Arthrobacter TaxID=235627 RepID=UPI002E00E8DE|nr:MULTISPECIES: ADP/ATP-dependent (S)-NAD(P)H-hydrate dehydratase [unclassified Arthrobacter]MEC5192845.1 ADP-dependent NAD(P)H-hydrate dehydratase [Arthrobacter sp. MP_M4]MEC5204270.1 ADP-dependent NAD(P)H-hydrate dehydratase [Arthrobacter sp. MP_M7]